MVWDSKLMFKVQDEACENNYLLECRLIIKQQSHVNCDWKPSWRWMMQLQIILESKDQSIFAENDWHLPRLAKTVNS